MCKNTPTQTQLSTHKHVRTRSVQRPTFVGSPTWFSKRYPGNAFVFRRFVSCLFHQLFIVSPSISIFCCILLGLGLEEKVLTHVALTF